MALFKSTKRRATDNKEHPPVDVSVAVGAVQSTGRSLSAVPCTFVVTPQIDLSAASEAARSRVCLVLDCSIHQGELAVPGVPLFTLGDLDQVTLTAYVPQDRLGHVFIGQQVEERADRFPLGSVDFRRLSIRCRRGVLYREAMVFDQLEEIEAADDPDHFLFVGDDEMMNLVIAHDSRGEVHAVVTGDRVNLGIHDTRNHGVVGNILEQVAGRDHAHGMFVLINDGDGVDLLLAHFLTDIADGFLGVTEACVAFFGDCSAETNPCSACERQRR